MSFSRHRTLNFPWAPATLANATGTATTVAAPGVLTTDNAIAALSPPPPAGVFLQAHVIAGDTIEIVLFNLSGASQTIAGANLRIDLF